MSDYWHVSDVTALSRQCDDDDEGDDDIDMIINNQIINKG